VTYAHLSDGEENEITERLSGLRSRHCPRAEKVSTDSPPVNDEPEAFRFPKTLLDFVFLIPLIVTGFDNFTVAVLRSAPGSVRSRTFQNRYRYSRSSPWPIPMA
jgi:hypothetical protein